MSSIPDELFGNWLLTTFNGLDLSDQGGPFLMLLEPAGGLVYLDIQITNILNGLLEYRDGQLYGHLVSTRMLGPPLHMQIEQAFGAGFEAGMNVLIEEAGMIFSQGGNTFFFVAQTDSSQQ
ncbi:hypothetical protein TcCL_Unassigned03217 [Trypanosoma cruzi]|uniref:DUF306 domain-containing protein n=1 Tax=Trypanosoma cruzi (strain CL Brener) TaxID=353153 RepID=Q4DJ54_TRYCC|nr:hypothetical protein, conserved [Trypanosoma cruzi]EAN92547.1 hypothetical protein, conserved [Trypanosoma cruzi]RNC34035.1 hypothetical protein TcCL_Unassigned03217 [Trypanosoma cruzi]|eukprot:XP_814398.1 hypothetical protein [Trypanosoma cruzi strain CL Brener]